MTTLAVDAMLGHELGDVQEYLMIASDIIYQNAAVGLVDATGHARPLNAADRFVGFAEQQVDNSAGAAAAKSVRVKQRGKVQLAVTGAVITDVGQPVYATDDAAFGLTPVGGVFIGYVDRFVAADVAIVKYGVQGFRDPWYAYSVREALTGTKTFDVQDNGKLFCVTAAGDGDALTLPAIADGLTNVAIMAVGAFGTTALTIAPAAADGIAGPDLAQTDNTALVCTKATQRRGDFVVLVGGDADGYAVAQMRGIWAHP